jgi:hypothetical protein
MPAALQKKPWRAARPEKEYEWTEIPVFIHGINPKRYPGTSRLEYDELLQRVNDKLKLHQKVGFSQEKDEQIFVTWGVPTDPPQPSKNDKYLSEAERKIDEKARQSMGAAAYGGILGIHGAARNFFFLGISDIFYYVSSDGKHALRYHVFNYIAQRIREMDRGGRRRFSLTLFGHSAGSVILHDLLFHLFGYKTYSKKDEGDVFEGMQLLRRLIADGGLRVRHLYTFGSPITPLILRADSLIRKFNNDELLDPADIGLRGDGEATNPRWINFWSRYDLISCPVGFLYRSNGTIQDQEISTSLNPGAAHSDYWKSDQMADIIAKTF